MNDIESKIMDWLDNTDLNLSLSLESFNNNIICLLCGDSYINININENYYTHCDDKNDELLQSLSLQLNTWREQQQQQNITLDMLLDKLTIISNNLGNDDNDDFKDDNMSYSDDDNQNSDNEINTVPDNIEIIILKRKLTDKLNATKINNDDNNNLLKSTQKVEHFSSHASSLALLNDFVYHYQNGRKESGIILSAVNDDIFNWNVKFLHFNAGTQISTDLVLLDEKYGYSYVELNFQFQRNVHPYYPPLVTIIRPRFEGFMLGRLASMSCLKLNDWDPVYGLKDLFSEIKYQIEKYGNIICDSGLNDRAAFPEGAYSSLEHSLLKLTFVCEKTPRIIRMIDDKKRQKLSHDTLSLSSPLPSMISLNEKLDTSSADKAISLAEKVTDMNALASSIVNNQSAAATEVKIWAKGTGYGSDYTGKSKNWDKEQYFLVQAEQVRLKKSLLTEVFNIMRDNFDINIKAENNNNNSSSSNSSSIIMDSSNDEHTDCLKKNFYESHNLHRIIEESCLISLLIELADIDSVTEVEEKQRDLSKVVFQIIELIAKSEELQHFIEKLPFEEKSLRDSIESIGKRLDIYNRTSNKASLVMTSKSGEENVLDYISTVVALVRSVRPALSKVDVSSPKSSSPKPSSSSSSLLSSTTLTTESLSKDELEELYKRSLKDLQYAELDDISTLGYHYRGNLATSMSDNRGIRRLASEHSDWPSSLPLFLNSSIWIRASSERMDVVRFLISGPEGTPYSSGLFLFDAFFPSDYPNHPPKVNLMTTGGGSVRFNPNLYNCGKVCLSLLGTWPGDNGWDPKMSTFLQVLISIQSLILIEHPYFNEPGYERSMGTPSGNSATISYNKNIRSQNISFAMIDMMRNPPKGFEDVVRLHFKLKKDIIIKETKQWLDEDPDISSKINILLPLLSQL